MTCDTGAILIQLQKIASPECLDAVQAAASQADALLDSIQMPCLHASVPSAVLVHPSSSSSEGSCDDESDAEHGDKSSTKNGSLSLGVKSLSA